MSQCKYCKKESYGHPFCKECGKKYFNFIPEDEYVLSKSEPVKETTVSEKPKEEINNKEFHNKEEIYIITPLVQQKTSTIQYEEWKKRTNLPKIDYTNHKPSNITRCISCNNESNGYPYCRDCYIKQKNLINNNNNDPKTRERYSESLTHTTNNGTKVRSLSEKIIGNYLEKHKIDYEYEKEFKCSNGVDIYPDFYIKGPCKLGFRKIENVYIEHWGLIDHNDTYIREKYKKEMKFKIKEYQNKGITLICTYEKDLNKYHFKWFQYKLNKKLRKYKNNQINYQRES